MPRQRRLMGPRKKVDVGALQNLPREARLKLLIESVAEYGGTPESVNGVTFRKRLASAQQQSRYTG